MLRDKIYFESILDKLDSLFVYKNIKKHPAITALYGLLNLLAREPNPYLINCKYYEFISELIHAAEVLGFKGNVLKKLCIHLFLYDENIFSISCERGEVQKNSSLYQFAMKDIGVLISLMRFDIKNLCENIGKSEKIYEYTGAFPENSYVEQMENLDTEASVMESLIWYYQKLGCGCLSESAMFRLDEDGQLISINNADPITFDEIIGYNQQKDMLIDNTKAFIKGVPANNVLLVGGRGTGKSSCVKSLVNRFSSDGLKLIEITKDQINLLPKLFGNLKNRGKRFIIFIDDLSFEESEMSSDTNFKLLKTMLEGSVQIRPDTVLFYVTSNRRNIIQEKWSDKTSEGDEIHNTDMINEKLSLSDRFGLTIFFPKPTQEQYLNIVLELAKKERLDINPEFLKTQALMWEKNQKGLSGRTAKQFIQSVLWEIKNN